MVSADTKLGMKTAGASTTIAAATKENRTIVCCTIEVAKLSWKRVSFAPHAKNGLAQALAIEMGSHENLNGVSLSESLDVSLSSDFFRLSH